MSWTAADHTWAVCAYGESPFLEECLASLEAQKTRSRILIATSTPNDRIREAAERHGIPLYVNEGEKGIGADWNYGYDRVETPLVTVAHQDDLYEPEYTVRMLADLNRARDPILWFSEYWELRGGVRVRDNRNLKIKRTMLLPLRIRALQNSRFARRRVLSLGDPICCPAVTYVKARTGESPFSTTMKVSLDWDQWERQSRKRGAFVYDPEPLMCHRVHAGSETTKLIEDNTRSREDLEMYRRFWPEPIARRLAAWYSGSQASNQVEEK